jgi:hypothetical protein
LASGSDSVHFHNFAVFLRESGGVLGIECWAVNGFGKNIRRRGSAGKTERAAIFVATIRFKPPSVGFCRQV